MKKFKWLGFFAVILGILVFGNNSEASASELPSEEQVISFDATLNEVQEATYINEDGEEVTITIEPIFQRVDPLSKDDRNIISPMLTPGWSHYLPYGTTTGFKISGSTPYLGMSFNVDIYVPSVTSGSKFTRIYNKNHWVILGTLYDESLDKKDKVATYAANVSWVGGMGGSNVYLKATLSNNVISVSSRM
ncbi:hypothetical protein D1B31_18480 [Neobacillus notoginsengisoli]|uniref:DUF5626 domain-containing protein n=1 Tax=Neobacillus notoginsengisoli TaxID=1578198 RepID=A0A417YPZ3_9BACI|nr:DUF5626 family protein [Neobacillus notoginsengisoli]RHW36065.1 hypothetical protein D1B31_18480 [Neobacillus notoginsengisoli]